MKVAAIDCGTNSFHLLIARVEADGTIEPLDRAKDFVRLGDSAFKGVISPEAFARAVDALKRFKGLADRAQCETIVAVATSAIREAENGGDFVRVVRDETGIELTVIRGKEEARLIYLGARATLNLAGRRALIVDIGGGSVELMVGDGRELYFASSLKLGVLRLLEQFAPSDPITLDQRTKMAESLHRTLEEPFAAMSKAGYEIVAMSSGTARAVADLIPIAAQAAGSPAIQNPRRIAFKDVFALEEKLCTLTAAERARLPGLDPKRVDSIVPGVILVRSVLEVAHADEYLLCDTALREGLVADYAARNGPGIQLADEFPDLRRRSVVKLARRCQTNEVHSRHVARLALDLFRGTRPLHNLSNADGELLEFSALLHDIGFHIAASKHHKHSAYLIDNAGLQGFSAEEVTLLSLVARYHRKATPKDTHEGYSKLDPAQRERVRSLAALLRLADGLDRGYAQTVTGVRVKIAEKNVELVLTASGEPELELWGARRKGDLFSETFGRKIKLSVDREAPPA